jgi:hypothetical protein
MHYSTKIPEWQAFQTDLHYFLTIGSFIYTTQPSNQTPHARPPASGKPQGGHPL